MKIVVLDGFAENPGDLSWGGFEALGDFEYYDRSDPGEVISRIGDAEAIIVNKVPVTAQIMDACPDMKYIGITATGYNIIDIAAARDRGITVTNVPAYGTDIVAQFTIGLLLEICCHIGHHDKAVHEGRWAECKDFCFWDQQIMELAGKTMGIIGFGRIGKATGRIAQALGMNVIASVSDGHSEKISDMLCYGPVEEVIEKSDVIALHCPLTDKTAGIINRENIAKMKDGVIILNTARGPLVVEEDLAEALKSGKVAAAAVDVVSVEPIKEDNPLLSAPNCIITPHIAWAAKEARQRLMDIAVENLARYQAGDPVNVVSR